MGIFGIIGTIIVGFIVGWIATKIMPARTSWALLTTALHHGGVRIGRI
jgi:uncharacterized membrane protein YeaQ/YmgE (transglycosylase-associated protein family)